MFDQRVGDFTYGCAASVVRPRGGVVVGEKRCVVSPSAPSDWKRIGKCAGVCAGAHDALIGCGSASRHSQATVPWSDVGLVIITLQDPPSASNVEADVSIAAGGCLAASFNIWTAACWATAACGAAVTGDSDGDSGDE